MIFLVHLQNLASIKLEKKDSRNWQKKARDDLFSALFRICDPSCLSHSSFLVLFMVGGIFLRNLMKNIEPLCMIAFSILMQPIHEIWRCV